MLILLFFDNQSMNFHDLKHFKIISTDTIEKITSYFWTIAKCQELHLQFALWSWSWTKIEILFPGMRKRLWTFRHFKMPCIKIIDLFWLNVLRAILWLKNKVILFTFCLHFLLLFGIFSWIFVHFFEFFV